MFALNQSPFLPVIGPLEQVLIGNYAYFITEVLICATMLWGAIVLHRAASLKITLVMVITASIAALLSASRFLYEMILPETGKVSTAIEPLVDQSYHLMLLAGLTFSFAFVMTMLGVSRGISRPKQ